jgi:RNA recognition motif-containing protein
MSFLLGNVFVKGLDPNWTEKDLHKIFDIFGEIKSAKVSVNPTTSKSNGYGFVWFKDPSSATAAIMASKNGQMPF